jgi:hypothetical protein
VGVSIFLYFSLVVDCFLFDFLKSFLLLFKRCFFYFVSLIFSFFEFASPYSPVQSSPSGEKTRPNQVLLAPTQERIKEKEPAERR